MEESYEDFTNACLYNSSPKKQRLNVSFEAGAVPSGDEHPFQAASSSSSDLHKACDKLEVLKRLEKQTQATNVEGESVDDAVALSLASQAGPSFAEENVAAQDDQGDHDEPQQQQNETVEINVLDVTNEDDNNAQPVQNLVVVEEIIEEASDDDSVDIDQGGDFQRFPDTIESEDSGMGNSVLSSLWYEDLIDRLVDEEQVEEIRRIHEILRNAGIAP